MRAVAYARFSSDNQRDESIDAQLKYISEFAVRQNYELVKCYTDEARSATTDRRPGFQRMMSDATQDLFDIVIVHKLDRFSRDRYDFAYYRRHLKKNGIRLISVLENLDDSPESVLMESVFEGIAEYYSKNLAREVMRKGLLPNAEKCLHNGGIPPLGYNVGPDQKYVINEYEAEAVRLIFNMFARGDGYAEIIDALNEKGYKTKMGRSFCSNSLHCLLKNEKYKGTYIFNRTQRKVEGRRNGNVIKPDEEIIRIPGGMPAIVSEEKWREVAIRMERNKHLKSSYKANKVYALSGKIFCGRCGSAMVGNTTKSNSKPYSYYECSTKKRTRKCDMKSIGANYIDQEVIIALYDNIFSPKAIGPFTNKVYEYADKRKKEIPEYIKDARKQLQQIESEISNIVNAIAKGMFFESMRSKMEELEDRKSRYKNKY